MLEKIGIAAKKAAYLLSQASTNQKNDALRFIAESLNHAKNQIIEQNNRDISLAKEQQLSDALIDRLTLTESRLDAIINDVHNVISLKDPIGEIIDGQTLESGLRLQRKRVPLGVIGTIYESRPNVTIDVAALCLKTGNASILRGGKETIYSNKILVNIVQNALMQAKLPEESVQFIDKPDRQYINQLLRLDKYVDIIIPRGGAELHQLCREQSSIPVITGGIGVCHTFVDESADLESALKIIKNAKTQRPSTCNTLETLLIHQNIASVFLPCLEKEMLNANVMLHMDEKSIHHLAHETKNITQLNESELYQEWLSLDLNVCIVNDIDDAINFIRKYGSAHSDAILTRSLANAEKFTSCVDSAAVYVNASTRFTDGAQFGLGAEIAVSTQKLHARGPMGLEALTTYKWIGFGDDLIRS